MDIRYSANQKDFKRYTTEETRKEFLIENLYVANEIPRLFPSIRASTYGKTLEPTICWREERSVFSTSAVQEPL